MKFHDWLRERAVTSRLAVIRKIKGRVVNVDEIFALDPEWWYGKPDTGLYRHTLALLPENNPAEFAGCVEGIFWGEMCVRNVISPYHKDFVCLWPTDKALYKPTPQGVLRLSPERGYRQECLDRLWKRITEQGAK
jgi:hypothetical protein